MSKIHPLQDRVLIERLEELEEKTAGGIYIPDTAKEKPQVGIVRAVGPGRRAPEGNLIPVGVKEGDKVLFGKYSGTEVPGSKEPLIIVREDEILCTIA
ncbi:MAG TPA: co-chaperone GroES [Candidatus Babeliaceae bacterium]|nr:co-chaperone GroES [Candidatus Babeliaceae bacterium]